MGRPSKLMAASTGKISKSERLRRSAAEKALQGERDKLKPPAWLNVNQKKIFKRIVEHSEHLGNMDIYLVQNLAIAIDRLEEIEKQINEDPKKLFDADLMKASKSYERDFFACTKALCLFPNQRGNGKESGGADPINELMGILSDED